MRPITKFFLNIEDSARRYFERAPFIQAFIAGIGVIIFWRGIWELLDSTGVSPMTSIIIGIVLLGGVGVFIQTFIGNTIIIKSVKQEERMEKVEQKELEQVKVEEAGEQVTLKELALKIDELTRKIEQK